MNQPGEGQDEQRARALEEIDKVAQRLQDLPNQEARDKGIALLIDARTVLDRGAGNLSEALGLVKQADQLVEEAMYRRHYRNIHSLDLGIFDTEYARLNSPEGRRKGAVAVEEAASMYRRGQDLDDVVSKLNEARVAMGLHPWRLPCPRPPEPEAEKGWENTLYFDTELYKRSAPRFPAIDALKPPTPPPGATPDPELTKAHRAAQSAPAAWLDITPPQDEQRARVVCLAAPAAALLRVQVVVTPPSGEKHTLLMLLPDMLERTPESVLQQIQDALSPLLARQYAP